MQRGVRSGHHCCLGTGIFYRAIPHNKHSSFSRRNFSVSVLRSRIKPPPLEDSQYIDRVSGIWYIPNPTKTDYNHVLDKLPQLLQPKRSSLTVAIFFATPGTAQWFQQDHEFLTQAMNRIYGPVIPSYPPTSIVAVIDALPSPNLVTGNSLRSISFAGAEGIALCLLPQVDIMPSDSSSNNDAELPQIRFRSYARMNSDETALTTASVSLQVANTLFVNGQKSTLFLQAWRLVKDDLKRSWQASDLPESLSGLSIPINRYPRSMMKFSDQLEPISKPRKVVSSMGNVLREVEGDGGHVMKASAELEEKVPLFLGTKEAEHGPGVVQVYALLMPPSQKGINLSISSAAQPDEEQATHASDSGRDNYEKDGTMRASIHQALWNGGRMHKVTGGGGGWGKKAGLLSLDTSTDFGSSSEFKISMFPSLEDDDVNEAATASGEAIPIGYTVQFLATFVGREVDAYKEFKLQPEDAGQWTAQRWSFSKKTQRVTIGTTSPSQESNVLQIQHPWIDGKVIPVSSVFGMLSHNGICLRTATKTTNGLADDHANAEESCHHFRMDAPHTIMHSHWRASGPGQDQNVQKHPDSGEITDTNAQSLNALLDGAIQKAKRPLFRKIKYQPFEKFQIPRSKQKQLSSQTEFKTFEESTEPVVQFRGIRKFKSLKGIHPQDVQVDAQADGKTHDAKIFDAGSHRKPNLDVGSDAP